MAAILAAGWLALAAAPARARSSADADDRLVALERQVAALTAQLEALQEALAMGGAAPPAGGSAASPAAAAPATHGTLEPRITEVERRQGAITEELERLTLGEAAVTATAGEHGMGPAASKVYRTQPGFSLGGYGEMLFEGRDDGDDGEGGNRLDFLRAIVYLGYKFDDRWLFNSEIEYEHAQAGEDAEGEVSVEFAYLDYLARPGLNLRAGLVLIPMGFVNELHEPTVFLGARRPDVERAVIPSTWRENGVGLFGEAGPVSYRTYLVNGFDASGFSASGLRGGRQSGSEAVAEDLAWVGRVDLTPRPGLLVGGSLYRGAAGQGLADAEGGIDATTTIWEGHLEWRHRGFELRGLVARSRVADVARLDRALGLTGAASIGERQSGHYLQAAYDVLSGGGPRHFQLLPYLRWERYDTQARVPVGFARDPANEVESFTLGLAFKPIDQIVIKADVQDIDNRAGDGVNQLNVALGYIF